MNGNLIVKAMRFAIKAHDDTNQKYDRYYPYTVHLSHVVSTAYAFAHVIADLEDEDFSNLIAACWTHDLIEDARVTYNDLKEETNETVAEIVRAVTNYGRGRTRAERMPDFVYQEIRQTPMATFVKLCDRIANMEYSKMNGSKMFDKYSQEYAEFKKKLYNEKYEIMFAHLERLMEKEEGSASYLVLKNKERFRILPDKTKKL